MTKVFIPLKANGTLVRIAWAVTICVLIVLTLNSFIEYPGRDASAFVYVAEGVLEGEIPYLDRWDHKGPVIYLINLLGLVIGGLWGIWFVQTAFLIGLTWLAFKVVRQHFGVDAALFSVAVLLVYVWRLGGNLTEYYALLFQFGSLYLFGRMGKKQPQAGGAWESLLIGVLGCGCVPTQR